VIFDVEKDAAQFIRNRKGAVVIGLNFEPSLGGCACSPTKINGSYVPVISLGRPPQEEEERYRLQRVEDVEVYFALGLATKQGSNEIRIRLRGFSCFRWLELEGARGIASYGS
jgi:hypothetical protein